MAKNESFNVGRNINFAGFSQKDPGPKKSPETKKPEIVMEEPKEKAPEKVSVLPAVEPVAEQPKEINSQKEEMSEKNELEISSVRLVRQEKKLRNVHKNFLFTSEIAERLEEETKKLGMSQNDFMNELLTQVFKIR